MTCDVHKQRIIVYCSNVE